MSVLRRIKLAILLSLAVVSVATPLISQVNPPYGEIVAINPNGVVSAREIEHGLKFYFRVTDQALLARLQVGQPVWVGEPNGQGVALSPGGHWCCLMEGSGRGTVDRSNTCCELVANPALAGQLGRLVVAFPESADVSRSLVDVFRAGEHTAAWEGQGSQTWDLEPGMYAVTISGKRVERVMVSSHHDTRVRVGALRV